MTAPRAAAFDDLFERAAARIRGRQLSRAALSGATIGLVLGAAAAAGCWRLRLGSLRPTTALLGLVGAGAGALVARRRRFDDEAVALYLDGRLGSPEVVTTAVLLQSRRDEEDSARGVVLGQAATLLQNVDHARVRPPIWRSYHAVLPIAAVALVFVSTRALPPAPVTVAPPGMAKVTLADVRGLEKVAELGALNARDEEQKKRLEKLAEDARKLSVKLRDGVEQREAQSEIAKLQDAIAAERMSLGDGDRRKGLEAALARLAADPLTKDAAKALGDRDLVKFDEEMQKLANSREKADRDQAKKALEEAAEAAKKAGANDVGKALDDQRKLLAERGKRADELRELGKALEGALSQDELDELKAFGANKSDKSAAAAAKALGEALKKLSPEERQRLGEKLKKKLSQQGAGAGDDGALKDLAKDLESEEGRKRLEDELRKLANEDTDDEEAERQKRLAEAEKGLGQPGAPGQPPPAGGAPGEKGKPGAGRGGEGKGLGAMPLPIPGAPGQAKPGDASGSQPGGSGHAEDTGTGDHKGQSKEVAGGDLRARAGAKMNGGAPNAGVTIGRSTGREGETANVQGNGGIGRAAPGEVSGVEKSDVPEEYREHVGRYFQP